MIPELDKMKFLFSPQYDSLVSYFTNLSYVILTVMVALMTGMFPRHSVKYLFVQTPPMFTRSPITELLSVTEVEKRHGSCPPKVIASLSYWHDVLSLSFP